MRKCVCLFFLFGCLHSAYAYSDWNSNYQINIQNKENRTTLRIQPNINSVQKLYDNPVSRSDNSTVKSSVMNERVLNYPFEYQNSPATTYLNNAIESYTPSYYYEDADIMPPLQRAPPTGGGTGVGIVPVGDPLYILFVFALLYIAFLVYKNYKLKHNKL